MFDSVRVCSSIAVLPEKGDKDGAEDEQKHNDHGHHGGFILLKPSPSVLQERSGWAFQFYLNVSSPDFQGSHRSGGNLRHILLHCDTPLVVLDPRVHEDIQDVHYKSTGHQEHGKKYRNAHNQRIIPAQDAGGEQAADAGDAEHLFDDEGAGDHHGYHGTDIGHHGEDGVSQGMLGNDLTLGDSLCTGGTDIVLIELLDHGGAHQAGDKGHGKHGRHQNGTDVALPLGHAEGGHQSQYFAEQKEIERGKHEARDGGAQGGQDHKEAVHQLVLPQGGQDSGQHPEDDDQERGINADAQRVGEARADDLIGGKTYL